MRPTRQQVLRLRAMATLESHAVYFALGRACRKAILDDPAAVAEVLATPFKEQAAEALAELELDKQPVCKETKMAAKQRLKAKLMAVDDFELKQESEKFPGGLIEGHANTFDVIDRHQEVVRSGAFRNTIADFDKGKVKIPLFNNHLIFGGVENVIGKVFELKEDRKGLFFRAFFSTSEQAQKIRQLVQEGMVDSLSIGFQVVRDRVLKSGLRELLELKLREISVVIFPANENAKITAVKTTVRTGSGYQNLMSICSQINSEAAAEAELRRGAAMRERLQNLEHIGRTLDTMLARLE